MNGSRALVRTALNPKQTGPVIGYQEKEVEYQYDITYVHVKYTVCVTVGCRDIDSIIAMAGLWEGLLPEDEAKYKGIYVRKAAE